MRVKFWCNNGANCKSKREETFDTEDWNISSEEWHNMTEEEKNGHLQNWINDSMDSGYEELERYCETCGCCYTPGDICGCQR